MYPPVLSVVVDGVVKLVLHVFWGTMGYCLHPPVLSVVVDGVITLVLHVVWGYGEWGNVCTHPYSVSW